MAFIVVLQRDPADCDTTLDPRHVNVIFSRYSA